ncbi:MULTISPECIES: NAD(P)/FAD-dependent oxidoreductase [Nocardia]|uniref:NAD(P)/FAD-dependent oxidoreductase n=1 Tax=Nocardia TaxID=1817 RepID=UPI0007EB337A|nr:MULTISPECIES: NAD(P)/FAD-dependent oxidoreductase [Nocardia]MBF6278426.1 NAD(P)/FAD-dependent oxidoreductase [Nocardia nova]OBA50508.1 ferredoxin--NADP(+) reductase [Nocardia sp. 852002-51101_SCH5132738]OBB45402.1 ferredoxin--NADP(+) reductase [Nocardia sp. 852002-51244_SCH5132740]OBF69664.1 ferredoxin--NADP(+) reductase [Mycobacterium sp. 852002-51759_SCH5129042]
MADPVPSQVSAVDVDVLFIGAGPVGLFGAYYAGFRGLSMALIDPLPEAGGQVQAIYPEKSIYDIAGFPGIQGQQLIRNLMAQAMPFGPILLLSQRADTIDRSSDGRWHVVTSRGVEVHARALILTSGVGSVIPRQLPCGEEFLGRGMCYFVPRLDLFDGQDVVVVGGGDSAVDWALAAVRRARSVTLVHRRKQFRAHEHSVRLLRESTCELLLDATVSAVRGAERVESVEVRGPGGAESREIKAQVVVAALGFTMDLGPIATWGLELHGRAITVDRRMRTNLPAVFAAGDAAVYEGKVKLIAVGFGEVALAVNNAVVELNPDATLAPGHSSDLMAPAIGNRR